MSTRSRRRGTSRSKGRPHYVSSTTLRTANARRLWAHVTLLNTRSLCHVYDVYDLIARTRIDQTRNAEPSKAKDCHSSLVIVRSPASLYSHARAGLILTSSVLSVPNLPGIFPGLHRRSHHHSLIPRTALAVTPAEREPRTPAPKESL